MYVPYFHNGRKMPVPLPLWQGAEYRGGPGSTSRRGRSVPGLPQRQENTGSAAVVEWGGGPGSPGKCLSQGSVGSGASATAGKCQFRCRCGKGRRTKMAREVPVAGVGRFRGFRNGRKIRVPLPLWQGAEDRSAPGCTSRRGRPVPGLPQRQENAGFAAVVARGGQIGMPQGAGNRSGRKGTEERDNMERRYFIGHSS